MCRGVWSLECRIKSVFVCHCYDYCFSSIHFTPFIYVHSVWMSECACVLRCSVCECGHCKRECMGTINFMYLKYSFSVCEKSVCCTAFNNITFRFFSIFSPVINFHQILRRKLHSHIAYSSFSSFFFTIPSSSPSLSSSSAALSFGTASERAETESERCLFHATPFWIG